MRSPASLLSRLFTLATTSSGVALAWILLFKLNAWLFAFVTVSENVSWVFLPAAIRVLAVMLFGWTGALGLFGGGLLTSNFMSGGSLSESVVLAGLSALGPLVAVRVCAHFLQTSPDLGGLGAKGLFIFAVAGAVFNVVPHSLYLYEAGKVVNPLGSMASMFVGDLVGTLMVLYAAAGLLGLMRRVSR